METRAAMVLRLQGAHRLAERPTQVEVRRWSLQKVCGNLAGVAGSKTVMLTKSDARKYGYLRRYTACISVWRWLSIRNDRESAPKSRFLGLNQPILDCWKVKLFFLFFCKDKKPRNKVFCRIERSNWLFWDESFIGFCRSSRRVVRVGNWHFSQLLEKCGQVCVRVVFSYAVHDPHTACPTFYQ